MKNPKERSLRDWAQLLPEDVREKFIANVCSENSSGIVADGCYILDESYCEISLAEALKSAFIWEASPEGREFWTDIYYKNQAQ